MILLLFLLSLGLFLSSFALLQNLLKLQVKKKLQKVLVLIGGASVWSVVIFAIILLYHTIDFYMTADSESIGWSIVGLIFLMVFLGYIYQYFLADKLHDIRQYFIQFLLFRGYTVKKDDIYAAIEQKKIKDVHREITGEPLPDLETSTKKIVAIDTEKLRQELSQLKSKPIRSMHFEEEISRLKLGETVDISESWRMNSMKQSLHQWFALVTNVQINPNENVLSLQVMFNDLHESLFVERAFAMRFRQNLYEFLQSLHLHSWIVPYEQFFTTITLECFGTQPDTFSTPKPYAFLKFKIETKELRKREGIYFDVWKLETIGEMRFKNGAPI